MHSFYSDNLKKLGHEANDIYVNNETAVDEFLKEYGDKYVPIFPSKFANQVYALFDTKSIRIT